MKIRNVLFAVCVLTFIVIRYSFPQAAAVWMPDENLRRVVREKLNIPDGIVLTKGDMLRLYDLVSINDDIENLRGLEYAVNLEFLHIAPSLLKDLSPLSELPNLRVLALYANRISDIIPLRGLMSLEVLRLESNMIVDLSPLANLRNLKELYVHENQIADFSPLAGLTNLEYLDYVGNPGDVSVLLNLGIGNLGVCDLSRPPTAPRVESREYPSVFAAWANIINIPTLSHEKRLAYHDLYLCCPMLGLGFVETEIGIQLVGNLQSAMEQRRKLTSENPNFILLVGIVYYNGNPIEGDPEDSPNWLRDEEGNRVTEPYWNEISVDFTRPEIQEQVIQQAQAVAKCGLFDGIFLDHWSEDPRLRGYRSIEEEHIARDKILRGIRAAVGDDFLILVNTNRSKIPKWAEYINGTFMETLPDISTDFNDFQSAGYTLDGLREIESTLTWAEENLREPRINALEGWGLIEELPDSSRNQQWMRLFTTMSLTHSDGYVLYTLGSASLEHEHPWDNAFLSQTYGHFHQQPHVHDHDHYWYDFWDADLGKPIGEKAQLYRNRDGLFIREFTNGWAVYNRSGRAHHIQFREKVSGVASGRSEKLWHEFPDLDGEIYLKSGLETPLTVDVNGDGVVNILDLVIIANAFGAAEPDLNSDGMVNILDLVVVANAFGD